MPGGKTFFPPTWGGVRHFFYILHFLSTLSVAYSTYLTLLQSKDNSQLFKILCFAPSFIFMIHTLLVRLSAHCIQNNYLTIFLAPSELYKCKLGLFFSSSDLFTIWVTFSFSSQISWSDQVSWSNKINWSEKISWLADQISCNI